MDKDIYDLTQTEGYAVFKKKALPAPLPPIQFQFRKEPEGITGLASTETIHIWDDAIHKNSYLTEDMGYDPGKVSIRKLEGQYVSLLANMPYSTSKISNTSATTYSRPSTASEMEMNQKAVERMVEEMTRLMKKKYEDNSSYLFKSSRFYYDDEMRYRETKESWLNTQLNQWPTISPKPSAAMKEFLDSLDGSILKAVPSPKPEEPTQLELF